jgi:hypothetical protein
VGIKAAPAAHGQGSIHAHEGKHIAIAIINRA